MVIILGCIEGEFPKGLPKDLLMDEWLKGLMGLPGWQYVEALEEEISLSGSNWIIKETDHRSARHRSAI